MPRALTGYLRTFTGFSRNAKLFLLTSVAFGAAISLYWIDFNLYLESIGVNNETIGWLMAFSQLAGVLIALPASILSDRFGRRKLMACGMALVAVALLAFLPGDRALLFLGVAALGAGSQIVYVVQIPFIAANTEPHQRNEYFSIWQAIGTTTALVAALAGGALAPAAATALGLHGAAAPYHVLLAGVSVLAILALGTVYLLRSDPPAIAHAGEAVRSRFGLFISDRGLFVRLLLPGFITSLGAGQLIPFLNVFVKGKFGLDLTALNAVFAITSLGTTFAFLAQPALARRFGRIGSIVLVQGCSIPFLVVLGFSPVLWTVIGAMTVRNSLMNAGSPIFDAFVMERVSDAERATLSAAMTLLWALGWTIAPIYYGQLQHYLGFTAGYAVDFVTIIVLYTIATSLLWHWFHDSDHAAGRQGFADGAEIAVAALPADGPNLLEHS